MNSVEVAQGFIVGDRVLINGQSYIIQSLKKDISEIKRASWLAVWIFRAQWALESWMGEWNERFAARYAVSG